MASKISQTIAQQWAPIYTTPPSWRNSKSPSIISASSLLSSTSERVREREPGVLRTGWEWGVSEWLLARIGMNGYGSWHGILVAMALDSFPLQFLLWLTWFISNPMTVCPGLLWSHANPFLIYFLLWFLSLFFSLSSLIITTSCPLELACNWVSFNLGAPFLFIVALVCLLDFLVLLESCLHSLFVWSAWFKHYPPARFLVYFLRIGVRVSCWLVGWTIHPNPFLTPERLLKSKVLGHTLSCHIVIHLVSFFGILAFFCAFF